MKKVKKVKFQTLLEVAKLYVKMKFLTLAFYTGGCIKWDSIKWDKTNQRKPKTYAKTLESALTAVSINFSAQKIHKNCCLNVPCILHLKRKIFFGYFSSFVDVRIKFFLSHFIHPPVYKNQTYF